MEGRRSDHGGGAPNGGWRAEVARRATARRAEKDAQRGSGSLGRAVWFTCAMCCSGGVDLFVFPKAQNKLKDTSWVSFHSDGTTQMNDELHERVVAETMNHGSTALGLGALAAPSTGTVPDMLGPNLGSVPGTAGALVGENMPAFADVNFDGGAVGQPTSSLGDASFLAESTQLMMTLCT